MRPLVFLSCLAKSKTTANGSVAARKGSWPLLYDEEARKTRRQLLNFRGEYFAEEMNSMHSMALLFSRRGIF